MKSEKVCKKCKWYLEEPTTRLGRLWTWDKKVGMHLEDWDEKSMFGVSIGCTEKCPYDLEHTMEDQT